MHTATNPEVMSSTTASFPAEASSATSARHFVAGFLDPLVDDDLVDVAALLTTELATNSVLHARSAIDVGVTVSPAEVRVEISDAHPGRPRRVHADERSTSGRGLAIVEHLSDEWGVAHRGAGKGVWFALHR